MKRPDYLGSYVDRRMKYLIEEWDLATRRDLGDLVSRLSVLEEEARMCAGFEATASAKLTELEKRLEYIRGRRQ
ncbi:MAG: hypothetical protein NQU46_05590 [Methanolinea sp.]|nr:hypothetical protein [Methanolinea sp.]